MTDLYYLLVLIGTAVGGIFSAFYINARTKMSSLDNDPIVPIVVAPKQPPQPSKTVVQPIPLLEKFCTAIRDYEGKPGDRNYRNQNPGNCRYSSVGYLPIYGTVGRDAQNFAIFKDYATGFLYLKNLITYKIHQNPDWTIQQLVSNYAPSSDGNNPKKYAASVSKAVSLSPADKASQLLG